LDRSQLISLLAALYCCGAVLTLLLGALGVGLILGTNRARAITSRLIAPDPEQLEARLRAVRERRPDLTDQQVLDQLVTRQATIAGLIGGLTGIAGLYGLPIGLPIDLAASARIQSNVVQLVGRLYAPHETDEERRASTVVILSGKTVSRKAAETSTAVAQSAMRAVVTRLFAQSLAEALLKFLPYVGAIVGFVFNWGTTKAAAAKAVAYYGRGDPSPKKIQSS
jgi:hypothetical protein